MAAPIIRIKDIAWIRLRSPDLDRQEEYLRTFGLSRVERTANALYMRGTDPAHHIHITEKGDPAVLRIGFWAQSLDDLHKLSTEAAGASAVESLDEPGGGKRVRLKEHNGMELEVVWGVADAPALPVETHVLNVGYDKHRRNGDLLRVDTRPSQVKRIGHVVISTPEIEKSVAWAQHHLGIVASDEVHAEDDPATMLASFNRVDAGEAYVDHHVIMFGRHASTGLNHVSFEVQDFDDLAVGHEALMAKYADLHLWGLGRHTLGSQIFDYWRDPWGRVHEHWTDTDMLNNQHAYRLHPKSRGLRSQWGDQAPQAFRDAASR
jgi:catechol 2,3-dioxygenase-like lactoylglutathione lyase family enzyme